MNGAADTHLIVNSDDFGFSHSVNVGIVEAFERGLLTQASIMATCPWFEEAVELTHQHKIPVGVHLTATCDFDRYTWGPLTGGRSLVNEAGRFPPLVEDVQATADPRELEAEYIAQVELVLARGLRPQHVDWHMGLANREVVQRIARRYMLPLKFGVGQVDGELIFAADSFTSLSSRDGDKVSFMRDLLRSLSPGSHILNCHVAADSDELSHLSSPDHPQRRWTRQYRIDDLAAVTNPEVIELAEELGIVKTAIGDLTTAA